LHLSRLSQALSFCTTVLRPTAQAVTERLSRSSARLIVTLLVAAIALRVVLLAAAPAFGYVWDFYSQGVVHVYQTWEFPETGHCWVCGHPPLFFLAGTPFYAVGRWLSPGTDDAVAQRFLSGVSLLSATATTYYGYRVLKLFRCSGGSLVAGLSVLLVLPCLFISANAPEADILLTALLSAFVFYLTRDFARRRLTPGAAVRVGLVAGLAIATKYSGLVAPLSLLATAGLTFWRSTTRRATVVYTLTALVSCGIFGGWAYARNVAVYGQLLPSNGTSQDGLSVDSDRSTGAYSFTDFRLDEVATLLPPDAEPGELTVFPVYRSVLTTLHAQAWSDMSFFSVRSRHGDQAKPYPDKVIPRRLTMAVLVLAVLPNALAAVGFVVVARRRLALPLLVVTAIGLSAYVWWFLPQQDWALKTKYVLFLVLPYLVYLVAGLSWLWRRVPALGLAAAAGLALLVVLTHAYLFAFAYSGLI